MRSTGLLVTTFLAAGLSGQEPISADPRAPDALAVATKGEDKPFTDVTFALRHEPAIAPCVADPKVPCASSAHWIVEVKRAGVDPKKALRFTVEQVAEIENELRSAVAARVKRDKRADPPPFEVGIVAPAIVPFAIVRRLHDVLASAHLLRFHVVVATPGKRRIEQCLSFEIPATPKADVGTTPEEQDEREVAEGFTIPLTVGRTESESVIGLGVNRFKKDATGAGKLRSLLKDARNDLVRVALEERARVLISEDSTATWSDVVFALDAARDVGFERLQLAPPPKTK